jgi:hypothetical protein
MTKSPLSLNHWGSHECERGRSSESDGPLENATALASAATSGKAQSIR